MNKKQLLICLQEGRTVITPNNRLSNELLNDYWDTFPKQVQEKPLCLPYSAFLRNSFQQLCHQQNTIIHPILLAPHQLRHLWRQILTSETNVTSGLLAAIEEAWTRCNLWMLDFNHPAFGSTPQTRRFQQWAHQLQQELDRLNALSEAQLATYLCKHPNGFNLDKIIWACFDDFTPQQKKLQAHLATQNCQSDYYDLEEQETTAHQYAAQNSEDEQEQLFSWLSKRLAHGDKRIGVIVPNLETQSSSLQRRLQQHISPSQFNISLGKSLIQFPLVTHAFHWLFLDGKKLNLHQARLLLHSPYLAYSQTEFLARSQLMESSVCLQELNFAHSTFVAELKTKTPKLANLLENVVNYPEKASVQTWIQQFHKRLQSLGFPGEYPLNSVMYQCYQRFLMVFDEFKQLTLITEQMSKEDALTTLKDLAESTIFQAKKPSVPIQILGLLEASGCTFDSLWMTGVTDQCLPQSSAPSAFIPLSLQHEHLLPHANHAKERYLAEKTVARLQNASPSCIFSYPRLSDDKPNLPSPLITKLPTIAFAMNAKNPQKPVLENVSENYALPLIAEEKISGGTAILANQAKCPFRAFAAHRLNVRNGLESSDGPDAKERGQLIHKVMEILWTTLTSQENFLQLEPDELNQQIETAIHTALEPVINLRTYSFSPLIQEVEFKRLKQLVHANLEWERQRPPFTVEALEQAFTIKLADMEFKVRVDRLDKLTDGQKWVIDYKTTLPHSLPWNEERPKEPQLLLYALLDDAINTLLFTQLKAGQLTPKGLSEDKLSIQGISTLKSDQNWTEIRQHWHTQLNELAHEFLQGHSPPQPSTFSVCQQCDYQNLCRFNPQET